MALGIFIFIGFFLLFILFIISMLIFWIWMIVDCVKRDFKKSDDKIIWLLVIILVQFIGAIIYYFVIKRKNKK